jgi:hypothetical protein
MIIDSIARIREQIASACRDAGRSPEDVLLVAVSKTYGTDIIQSAFDAGLRHFGENKPQELRDKAAILTDTIIWHFIGSLQTNKVKYVVNAASYIHSIDSLKLAEEIARQATLKQKRLKCLIEVKTSFETSKAGIVDTDELFRIAEFLNKQPALDLCGLMTIAPFVEDSLIIRNSFRRLYNLRDEMKRAGFPVSHLSMGMTGDFREAISEGATIIRVGTAIFGNRVYNR